MRSEFEQHAARAAVDAVEARWRHNHEIERRQALRKRLRSLTAVCLLALIAGGGLLAWQWQCGCAPSAVAGLVEKGIAAWREFRGEQPPPEPESACAFAVRQLLSLPVRMVSEMPPQANPKKAPKGSVFEAVSLASDGVPSLYRLTANGRGDLAVVERRPFAKERTITWDTFRFKCKKPYLIRVGQDAYLCGSKDLRDASRHKERVLAALDALRDKPEKQ